EPGAEAAVRETKSGRIGVIGTRATVASGAYVQAIHAAARRAGTRVRVDAIACPLLVPLAEEGMENSRAAREVLRDYLAPLQKRGIDTLILGCTHYPPFRRAIQGVLGARVKLVDSGEATARQLARQARDAERAAGRVARPKGRRGTLECFVSDIPLQFERIGRRFLGRSMGKVGLIPQDDLPWFERNPIQGGR
ncbi:MAG TPA: aspartate/glutamate racemase family protein, partial [Candidatus Eisenbacteria bacterium]|nr:aspartate/glutamate racemase family protein [Candidatus Eisenbacteria bacterium]